MRESWARTLASVEGPLGDPLGSCVSYLAQRPPDCSSARQEIRIQRTVVTQTEPSALGRPSEGTQLFVESYGLYGFDFERNQVSAGPNWCTVLGVRETNFARGPSLGFLGPERSCRNSAPGKRPFPKAD